MNESQPRPPEQPRPVIVTVQRPPASPLQALVAIVIIAASVISVIIGVSLMRDAAQVSQQQPFSCQDYVGVCP